MGGNGGKDCRGISVFGLGSSLWLLKDPGVSAFEFLGESNDSEKVLVVG